MRHWHVSKQSRPPQGIFWIPDRLVTDVRRRNLVSFPYFVLYGLHADLMVFGALIPSASDPLTWLERFSKTA
jgi:hypothetical protein